MLPSYPGHWLPVGLFWNRRRERHKTLVNWYTTLLNAYGNPIDPSDLALKGDQRGPIEQLLS